MNSTLKSLEKVMRGAGGILEQCSISLVQSKSKLDYVTNIDFQLDAFLTQSLETLTPGVPVLSEERLIEARPSEFWIIDPLDGTHNMIAGLPFFAISVALCDHQGIQLSAVLNVKTQQLYLAQRGGGASCNGEALQLAKEPSTLMAISSGMMDRLMDYADIYRELRDLAKLRNLGSQALQLTSVAQSTLGFCFSEEAKFWDDAAGRLVVEEAGAIYFSFSEEQFGCHSNELLTVPMKSVCAHPKLFEKIHTHACQVWSYI